MEGLYRISLPRKRIRGRFDKCEGDMAIGTSIGMSIGTLIGMACDGGREVGQW